MTPLDAIAWLSVAVMWAAAGFSAGFYYGRRSSQSSGDHNG